MTMLEGEISLTLDAPNLATQAWVEQQYHRTRHSEIDATPLAHYLAGPTVARPSPATVVLDAAFRIEVVRRQRRSDGTVNLNGTHFEIPSRYRRLEQAHLRYARLITVKFGAQGQKYRVASITKAQQAAIISVTILKSDLSKRVTSPPAKAAKLKKMDVFQLLPYRMNVVSNLLLHALVSHFATVGEIGLLAWRALT